jgi:hypothetical protein
MISTSNDQSEWVYRATDRPVQQQLYDSAINFEIATLSECGFLVKLGDRLNGYKAAATFETWSEVKEWLLQQAIAHFPESKVAREHGVFRSNVLPLRLAGAPENEAAATGLKDVGVDEGEEQAAVEAKAPGDL